MTNISEPAPRETFSEKHGGKVFAVTGFLLSIILGSTICLVMEETFRTSFFNKAGILVRLISLGPLPMIMQFVCGLVFISCMFFLFRRINNKGKFEAFSKTFLSCLIIFVIHISVISGLSYFGAAGFTGITESGFLVVNSTWKAELTPWTEVSSGSLDMVKGNFNRDMLKYTIVLKNGETKEILARVTDVKSITETSWVFNRQDIKLKMSVETQAFYKKLLSVFGN